jgi:thiamine-monophosphate kinase
VRHTPATAETPAATSARAPVQNRGVLGEFELIERLRELISGAAPSESGGRARVTVGSGDDAAVTIPDGATVTSVDALVDGVHFRRETWPVRSIGWKALAAALSDLAAMGAEPGEAYVQLVLPADLPDADSLELGAGLAAAAREYGIVVLGGDVSRGAVLTLAVTAVGHAGAAEELVTRGGAVAGDVIALTGELGGAAAGLILLDRPELSAAVSEAVAERLRRRQLEPTPRLAAGRALASAGARAMIDLSDGLGADAGHIAAASGACLAVDLEQVPVQDGVVQVAQAAGADALDLATAAGEDYELLCALPAARVEKATGAVAATGTTLTVVGEVLPAMPERQAVSLRDSKGERPARGFDQLTR